MLAGCTPNADETADACRVKCPELRDASACEALELSAFPSFEQARATLERNCQSGTDDVFPFLVEGRCADGKRVLYHGTGFTIVRQFFAESGEFLAFEQGGDAGQGPDCHESYYWPVRVLCEHAKVTRVVCGTALAIGDPIRR